MNKNDSFFTMPVDSSLNQKILSNVQSELEINRVTHNRKRWFQFLAPVTAALASFLVFKVVSQKESEIFSEGPEQIELVDSLIENDESFEILENLVLLEDLETIEEIGVEDV